MSDTVIEMKNVCKRFGRQDVLKNMSLTVPKGSIYAFLGRNGEGKSTSIRMMLNLLSPESGTIMVLGRDARKDTEFIKGRVGYVPEAPHVYDWMTVQEIIAFTSEFYGTWDRNRSAELVKSLALPLGKRIQELSTGTKAKVGLLLAMAHNPELLILDDCTSGLDALVRREFSEHIVNLVADGTCTVFFSSHIITELERVADRVGLLKEGSLLFEVPLEELKGNTRKISASLDDFQGVPELLKPFEPSILRSSLENRELTVITREWNDALVNALKSLNPKALDLSDLELEDIFVEYTRDRSPAAL